MTLKTVTYMYVMSLTSWSHVSSSMTSPIDAPYALSYRLPIGHERTHTHRERETRRMRLWSLKACTNKTASDDVDADAWSNSDVHGLEEILDQAISRYRSICRPEPRPVWTVIVFLSFHTRKPPVKIMVGQPGLNQLATAWQEQFYTRFKINGAIKLEAIKN